MRCAPSLAQDDYVSPVVPWWSLPCPYLQCDKTNSTRTQGDCQNILTKLHLLKTLCSFHPKQRMMMLKMSKKLKSHHQLWTVPELCITETEIVIYGKQTQKLPNLNNYVSSGPCVGRALWPVSRQEAEEKITIFSLLSIICCCRPRRDNYCLLEPMSVVIIRVSVPPFWTPFTWILLPGPGQ